MLDSKLDMNSWLISLKPFGLTKNEEIKENLKKKGIEVYDFTLGDPKEPTPQLIRDALVQGLELVSQYPMNIGSAELRRACATWAKRRIHTNLDFQKQIISTNGSKEAIFHIHQVLLNSASLRRMIVFPEPGYPVYKAGVILAGGVPYEYPLNIHKNYIFDPNDVPKELLSQICALWVCYPHNPTGATISKQRMVEIYNWALDNNIVILSDECYIDMFYEGKEIPISFLEVSEHTKHKNILSFFSLSKRSGMTGYRSGFVAGDDELLSLFAKYRLNVGLGTPDFIQKAAVAAWNDDEHVWERNKIFASKRYLCDAFFAKNQISVLPSNATFYVWGEIPACYSSGREFVDTLLQCTGMMATPGDAFGSHCHRNFRLALVPTLEQINKCLELWQKKIDCGEFKL